MGLLRLAAGIAMLPLAWGAAASVPATLAAIGDAGAAEPVFWAGCGFLAFGAAWAFRLRPVRTYVLAHELTHALFGLLCGAKIGRLKVSANGGSVALSKSNMLITLSPYFFPFYAVLLAAAALAARLALGSLPCPPAWLFAAGFLWGFHFCFTLSSLAVRQPDIQEYGRVFSWTLVFAANAAFMALSLAAAGEVPLSVPASAAAGKALQACSAVLDAADAAAGWLSAAAGA